MKRLERWLKRTARAETARPRLVDALLGYRAFRYVAHRLRMTTLRVLLRTTLHLLEIAALSRVFPLEYLAPILLLRHSSTLIQSFWWGALEPQREAIRTAHRRRDRGSHERCVNEWSVLTMIAMTTSVLAYGVWIVIAPRPFDGFSVYDAYAIACALRTALELWSRSAHSAVFAVARIRRPMASFIVVDLVEVFGLLLAWLQIGAFAFALMLIVTGTLRAALTLHYTKATRVALALPATTASLPCRIRRVRWRELPVGRGLGFALGNLSLQLESLAIVLLSTSDEGGARLQIFLHGLSPLLAAGYVWSRIFYFDFKCVSRHASTLLGGRLGRLLDATALGFPCVLWALAWPLLTRLLPELYGGASLPLVLFIVARSAFSLRQVEAYSYVDWRVQIRQLLILFGGLGITVAIAEGHVARLTWISVALTLAAYLGHRASPKGRDIRAGEVLGIEAWLDDIGRRDTPLRSVFVNLDHRICRMGAFQRSLLGAGFSSPLLRLGRTRLMFAVEDTMGDETVLRRRLLDASAGTLLELTISRLYADGRTLLSDGILEQEGIRAQYPRRPLETVSVQALKAEFISMFADGTCLSEGSGKLKWMGPELRRMLGSLLFVATSLRDTTCTRRGCPAVVYRPFGRASILFVAPRDALKDGKFAAFARKVKDSSLGATLVGLRLR